ncbi:MAG: AAA family ATPase [Thermofilaceae archaeon]
MPALIKEVVLENFMSYKYARVPLAPGINIVTGPNGSGKSSLLLGISVALGQTYTERGRRLSDLIRRGEEAARVTVVIDNRPVDGRRPLPWFRSDEVFFTRYLRIDGQYWHEVNGRVVTKAEVKRYLSRLGLDPDNALIIMHQGVVEEFAFLSPQERLRLLEEAVGLAGYRERVLAAKRMLAEGAKSAEEVKSALARAREALKYWSEVYERYRRRRALEESLKLLRRELAWARVRDAEADLRAVEEELSRVTLELKGVEEALGVLGSREEELRAELGSIERQITSGALGLAEGLAMLRSVWEGLVDVVASARVKAFERRLLIAEREELEARRRRAAEKVRALEEKALEEGERVESVRSVEEIQEEIRSVELSLAAIGEIPAEVEEAYGKLLEEYRELEKRAVELEENKRRLEEELEKRISLWREKVSAVVEDVDKLFSAMLAKLGASGSVRLAESGDVESAGLEILVGYGGAAPAPLNPYSLSGGERTAAVVCFFLALQNHVKSPFRAVDEFDVHMDPRNRDAVLNMVFELAEASPGVQYVVITPGPLTKLPENAHTLIIQKVRGRTLVSLSRGGGRVS